MELIRYASMYKTLTVTSVLATAAPAAVDARTFNHHVDAPPESVFVTG